VPAPVSGVLREIKVQSGTTVKSGDVLAVIEEGAGAKPAASTAEPPASSPEALKSNADAKAGPAARRVIEENQLQAGSIVGSAPGGRITKNDAMAAASSVADAARVPVRAEKAPPPSAKASVPAAQSSAKSSAGTARTEQRVPMTRLRARVAERLVQAQATQALLTTFNEVDLTAVQELRAHYKDGFEKKYGVKLGFMSFFVSACVEALKRFPVVNASVENADIVYHEYFDIGVAVSTDRGLLVPILRNADSMSFADIEKAIADFAAQARKGSLALEDLIGGTFSITNGGVFGSLMSTPIVNAPQSAILGMHKIQERPMVVNGQITVRPMMYLAVTYDHRIIDGREAVQFLVTIKDCLEDPGRLLLGV
jgi:2-oxoglutarate dehydrogenase E2 component (dihydrolipoamide succinyltransferase)